MPYNATLCKEALGKVFVDFNHLSYRAILLWAYKNFYAVASGGERRTKTSFYRKMKNTFVIRN